MTEIPTRSGSQGGGALGLRKLLAQANAAWERDDFAAALQGFTEIFERYPDFPDVRNRAGVCRAMLDDPTGALEDFDRALAINPNYAEAHLNRALVLVDLARFDEARTAFDRARELDHRPGDPYPADLGNQLALEHARLGDLYLSASRPNEAVAEFEKALQIRPTFVDIRERLAQGFAAQGELESAVAELRRVLDEHPTFLGARLRLGAVLHRMGRTDEAIVEWRSCLEIEPQDARVRAYLSSVGVKMEEVTVPVQDGERDDA